MQISNGRRTVRTAAAGTRSEDSRCGVRDYCFGDLGNMRRKFSGSRPVSGYRLFVPDAGRNDPQIRGHERGAVRREEMTRSPEAGNPCDGHRRYRQGKAPADGRNAAGRDPSGASPGNPKGRTGRRQAGRPSAGVSRDLPSHEALCFTSLENARTR